MSEFKPMPKTPRLSREIVITEKIDGTNASVMIVPISDYGGDAPRGLPKLWLEVAGYVLFAGSRTRWITPEDDNFGFARWAFDHAEELVKLGPGHHFGEWWGRGIQRGYGLADRRFSLFNVSRWLLSETHDERVVACPPCCDVVPVLYRGIFDSQGAEWALNRLRDQGSFAAPGFMDPEGIMVYHTAAGQLFKKTLKGDEEGKHAEAHPKKERAPKAPRDPSKGGRRLADFPIDFPDRRKPK